MGYRWAVPWIARLIALALVLAVAAPLQAASLQGTGVVFLHGKGVWPGAFDGGIPGALEAVVGEGERVVIERSGMAVAAIVSLADLEALRRIEDEADLEAVRLAKAEGGDSIPYEQVRKELGLA